MKRKIDRIQAINLKTKTTDATLAEFTAIIGENGTGKSSIREAITLAVLGYSPTLGKKASAGSLMKVGTKRLDIKATLSTGEEIGRRWEQGRSLTATATGLDLSELISPSQLDFSVFFNSKATDRQRILESLIVTKADGEIAAEARQKIAAGALSITIDETADGWLGQLETDAKEAKKFAKQEADTAAATILTLSAAEQPPVVTAEALAAAAQRLTEATDADAAASARFEAIDEKYMRALEKPEGEPITAARIAEAFEAAEVARTAYDAEKTAWDHYLAAVKEAAAIRKTFPANLEAVEHPGVEFEDGDTLSAEVNAAANASSLANRNLDRAVDRKNAAALALDQQKKKRDELKAQGCCPTCQRGEDFAETIESLFKPKLDELTAELSLAEGAIVEAEAEVTKADERHAKAATRLREAAERSIWLKEQEALAILAAAPKPDSDLQAFATASTTAANAHRSLQSGAAQWEEWNRADIPSAEEIESARRSAETAEALKTAATEASNALKNAATAYEQFVADRRRLTELETTVEESAKKQVAATELAKWAKEKSLSVTVEALKPLLDLCNKVCDGILPGPVTIIGTDIGAMTEGGLVTLDTLSGAETVALGAALQIAIAKGSEFPIVLIDELNRFAGKKHVRFVENLARALADGDVDQIIVIDTPVTGTGPLVGSLGGSVVNID